jgi:hypothetical protein
VLRGLKSRPPSKGNDASLISAFPIHLLIESYRKSPAPARPGNRGRTIFLLQPDAGDEACWGKSGDVIAIQKAPWEMLDA